MKRTTPARKKVAIARKKASATRRAAAKKATEDARMFLAAVDALGKKV